MILSLNEPGAIRNSRLTADRDTLRLRSGVGGAKPRQLHDGAEPGGLQHMARRNGWLPIRIGVSP